LKRERSVPLSSGATKELITSGTYCVCILEFSIIIVAVDNIYRRFKVREFSVQEIGSGVKI
jgi:hypothetical protein